jgi:putative drug exporter of the RND superfamily
MELLGDKNWWMPAWLDRIIPKLNVEGSDHDVALADADAVGEQAAAPYRELIDA